MPPEPPRRRPPGGVLEEYAAHAPHTPVPPPPSNARTARPPAPDPRPPPVGLRGPRVALPPLQAPPASAFRDEHEEHTTLGLGPPSAPPSDDADRISTVEAIRSADTLAAELAKRNAENAALRKAIAERDAKPEPEEKPPSWKQWQIAAFKVVVPLGALLTAFASYLGVQNATTLPGKIENQEAKQKAVEASAETDHDALVKLREYVRASDAYRDCIDAQRDSAIRRGTGHRISSDTDSSQWLEQQMPVKRATLLWERAIWYPASPCAAKPKPP